MQLWSIFVTHCDTSNIIFAIDRDEGEEVSDKGLGMFTGYILIESLQTYDGGDIIFFALVRGFMYL